MELVTLGLLAKLAEDCLREREKEREVRKSAGSVAHPRGTWQPSSGLSKTAATNTKKDQQELFEAKTTTTVASWGGVSAVERGEEEGDGGVKVEGSSTAS